MGGSGRGTGEKKKFCLRKWGGRRGTPKQAEFLKPSRAFHAGGGAGKGADGAGESAIKKKSRPQEKLRGRDKKGRTSTEDLRGKY